MSSKMKILSMLLLSAALAGCGSTKTGSIDPGPGPVDPDPVDPDPVDPDPVDPDPTGPTTHNLLGKFLSFSKANSGNPDIQTGTMTVTIAEDGSTADLPIAGTVATVPVGSHFGTGADKFLDLDLSGENYTLGTYVTHDASNWHVGMGVDGQKTDQIEASATYNGQMRAAVVPVGWTQDVEPYAATGDVNLNLNVAGTSATVDGAITNVRVPELLGATAMPGQITLQQADVVNSAYSGTLTHNLGGGSGSGNYDGAFYGSDAAETAGTLGMNGTATTPDGVLNYKVIGGFGASK